MTAAAVSYYYGGVDMLVLISARGQYVTLAGNMVVGTFDNLRDAMSSVRERGLVPVFGWDSME